MRAVSSAAVAFAAIATLGLNACATKPAPASAPESQAMVRAEAPAMRQAPAPAAQPVRAPVSGPGPYVRVEVAHSQARKAAFRDDEAVSPTCFIAVNYPGVCGAALDHLGSSTAYGLGVGYDFGNGLRADLSYGHRGGFDLRGTDPEGTDFDPPVKSNATMASLFYDLPVNWGGLRPYVGGGIGRTTNTMSQLHWRDPGSSGILPGGRHRDTAWQLTLGANLALESGFVVEFGYRYLDMGRFRKSAGPDIQGQFNPPPNGTGSATGRLRADELFLSIRRAF